MIYKTYLRNHAVIPGQENALKQFLNSDYKGMKHKLRNGHSSHSEDALTWSCFKVLDSFPQRIKFSALDEILEDTYEGKNKFKFTGSDYSDSDVKIFVGKTYTGQRTNESTEVDASIELPDKLFFIEAKLYSSISLADKKRKKPHDQITRKLRVGLDSCADKDFHFIFLDIAPNKILSRRESKDKILNSSKGGFHDKYKSAWMFNYYKFGRNKSLKPLRDSLQGIEVKSVESVASNMGWLTWSDLYKIILRGILKEKKISG